MTTGSILFTLCHILLFFYMRFKYVRKYKIANQERAHFEVENIHLKSQIETLESFVDDTYQ